MWLFNILLGLDQTINAFLWGSGEETLSARCYRCGFVDRTPKKRWVFGLIFVDSLFFWKKNHCRKAYISEVQRKQLPSHYREASVDAIE